MASHSTEMFLAVLFSFLAIGTNQLDLKHVRLLCEIKSLCYPPISKADRPLYYKEVQWSSDNHDGVKRRRRACGPLLFSSQQLYLVVDLMGPAPFTLLFKAGSAEIYSKEHKAGKVKEEAARMEKMMMGAIENQSVNAGPTDTTQSSWKLYDNPHFTNPCHDSSRHDGLYNYFPPQASDLQLCVLLRSMDRDGSSSELQAQIRELRAELEIERRLRRKTESLNKALAQDLAKERMAREASEGLCQRLAEENASKKEELDRTVREMEEDRRMLRMAQVWREERVQIKLNEARLVMEEKLRELSFPSSSPSSKSEMPKRGEEELCTPKVAPSTSTAISPSCMNPFSRSDGSNSRNPVSTGQTVQHTQQRREVENPHVRRGIKGFVEFQRAVRVRANAIGVGSFPNSAREGKGHGRSNLECQRVQLRILSMHRNPVGLDLVGTSESLVM